MTETTNVESTADIIKYVKDHGFDLTLTTLTRWQREGLVPDLEIKWLGKGKGTTVLYPAGTCQQVLEIFKLKHRFYCLDDIGLYLWLSGFPVAERFSIEKLKNAARRLDHTLEAVKNGYNKLNSTNEYIFENSWDEFEKLSAGKISVKFVRKLRKRVGAGNFSGAIFILAKIASGQFQGFDDADYDSYMRSMMGLKNIKITIFDGALKYLKDSIEMPLIKLSELFGRGNFLEQIEAETKESLKDAQEEFSQLFFGIAGFSGLIFSFMNVKIPGYYNMCEIMEHADAFNLAAMFLAWSRIRKEPWAHGYPEIISALRQFDELLKPTSTEKH